MGGREQLPGGLLAKHVLAAACLQKEGRIGLAALKLQDLKLAVEAGSLALEEALQRLLVEFVARSDGC